MLKIVTMLGNTDTLHSWQWVYLERLSTRAQVPFNERIKLTYKPVFLRATIKSNLCDLTFLSNAEPQFVLNLLNYTSFTKGDYDKTDVLLIYVWKFNSLAFIKI